MGKLKFTLSNILFWTGIIASCLLLEDVGFLTTSYTGGLAETHFFMLFTIAFGSFLSFFLIEHIKNKVSVDYVLIGVLIMCYAMGCVAIWAFDGVVFDGVQHFEYLLSYWEQGKQTISLTVFMLATYATLFHFNKNYPSIRKIKIVYILIIVLCLLASVYSWIFEYDSIIYNLTPNIGYKDITSFFWNPNMYCLMLLLGIFSCFGLNYYKKNVVSYIGMFAFMIMICLVASLTSIAVGLASLFVYFIIEIIFTMRKSHKRGLIGLVIYLFIIATIAVLLACALNFQMGPVSDFFKSVYKNFSTAHYANLTERTIIWDELIGFLRQNTLTLLFGVGFRNSYHVVGGLVYAHQGSEFTSLSCHSGYLQIFMNFGVVGLAAYAMFFFYYLYCLIRLAKKDGRFTLLFGLIGFALMGYAVMESIIFLNPNTLGLLICAFFYLPVINKHKHFKHHQLADSLLNIEKPEPLEPNLITKSVAKVLMSLVVIPVSFLIFPIFREDELMKYFLINLSVLIFVCSLFIPFISSCLSYKKHRFVSSLILSINSTMVGLVVAYLILRNTFYGYFQFDDTKWVFPGLLVMVFIGECIVLGFARDRKFKDYLVTYIGISKNSFMGLLGSGAIIVTTYFILSYMDLASPLTYVIYPFIVLIAYYLASYLVRFKDQKQIIKAYNQACLYSLKMDVLEDRLGAYDDKRRD